MRPSALILSFFSVFALSAMIAACGGRAVALPGSDGTGSGSGSGTGTGSGSGTADCPGPAPACSACGASIMAVCVTGAWQCPAVKCPAQCPGPVPACTDCNGNPVPADCLRDVWQCPDTICPVDAGLVDAESTDAGVGGSDGEVSSAFACGPMLTCDPTTSYCYTASGGPPPGATTYSCKTFPQACIAGQCAICGPTCGCLQAMGGAGCPCAADAGDVTVTCNFP